jgi:hypothetical protein
MVATGASMDLFQNLHPFFLRDTLLKQFLLHILTHNLPLDEYIVLATPDKALHLDLVMGNICRREIPYEWFSPVATAGRNRGDQLASSFSTTGFSSSSMDGLIRSWTKTPWRISAS